MNARKPTRLLDSNLSITKLRKTAAMLIALLLCLSVVSPPVYADTTRTVNIADTSMQECVRRFCVNTVGNVFIPGTTIQERVNACIQGGGTEEFKQEREELKQAREDFFKQTGHHYPQEFKQALCGDTVENERDSPEVSQDVAETYQKLKTLNDRFNNPVASQKIVIPWQNPESGVDRVLRQTGNVVDLINKTANESGWWAYIAYAGFPFVVVASAGGDIIDNNEKLLKGIEYGAYTSAAVAAAIATAPVVYASCYSASIVCFNAVSDAVIGLNLKNIKNIPSVVKGKYTSFQEKIASWKKGGKFSGEGGARVQPGRTLGDKIPSKRGAIGESPPTLKRIHSDKTLSSGSNKFSLDFHRNQSTDDIVRSLKPGSEEALRIKPDGRIINGNTRIKVLEERGFDINSLPREVLE